MARGDDGYKLPAYKPRDAQRRKKGKKVTPQPMKEEDLVAGWTGHEKDDLLKLGDMLPDDMRARPRAYLTYPKLSYQHEKYREHADRFEAAKSKDPLKPRTRRSESTLPSQMMCKQLASHRTRCRTSRFRS